MQQQGGSQYGVHPPPDMTPFSSPGDAPRAHILGISTTDPLQQQPPPQPQLAEAASPISSRPPPPGTAPRPPSSNFDELVPAVPGNFPDDEALAAAGEEVERSGAPGNRWPRQETLALLKIRSEMDAAFRDATLKGPLWEDVSRRLAELGYKRSAKKCKEKFENVHKYYKRTKEGRAGRQDGKSYRFFSQLEALHSSSSSSSAAAPGPATAPALTTAAAAANPTPTTPIGMSTGMAGPSFARIQPPPISAVAPPPIPMPPRAAPELTPSTGVTPAGISATAAAAAAAGISFSSNTSSSSSSESDDEETEEAGGSREGRKRKRSGSGSSRKMMAFFEGLMRQVMERQESMQQRFLETIERREQDRMIREEAWRRQEMARLNREHELLAQERAMAASRDAAVISYIQKISGQTIQMPNMPATAITVAPPPQPASVAPPPAPPPQQQTQQPQQRPPTQMQPSQQQQEALHQQPQSNETGRHQVSSSSELVPVPEPQEPVGTVSFEPVSSSRWPKAEVHALIKMRSGLDSRYQEAGPKGPLWEEISAGMQRLGYNRSSKRCKEKWENINKYFKKVKESNKKRPEDAKTCPYFHQLDALYRKKLLASSAGGGGSSGGTAGIQRKQEQETSPSANPQEGSDVPMIMAPPPPAQPQQLSAETTERKNGNNNNNNGSNNNRNGSNSEDGGGSGTVQMQTSNGGLLPSLFEEGSSGSGMSMKMKKPEGTVKELRDQRRQQATMEAYDKMEEADSDNIDQDDDDDDDEDDEDGKMQYKIEFQRPNVGGGGGTASTAAATAGSFLAMVQ